MLPTVADEQILRGVAATITGEFRDQHGELVEVGTVTVGVTAADGTVVLAPGTATTTPSGYTGRRQRALTAAQTAQLGVLTATWTDSGGSVVTTTVEIVGGYYADRGALIAAEPALDNTTKYPRSRIQDIRHQVEVEFESVCGVAFVPRYRRVWLSGTGTSTLTLPDPRLRAIRSVRVYSGGTTYSAFTAGELAAIPPSPVGLATRTDLGTWAEGVDNIVIEYEHGWDLPPSDLLGAFITRMRNRLNSSSAGIPDRASTYTSTEGGTFSLIVPGQRGAITGIPDVDVVLEKYADKVLGFA